MLVIDRRSHVGGNVYTEGMGGNPGTYLAGAHIFHTNDKTAWEHVNRFMEFNRYTTPGGELPRELYSLALQHVYLQ